MKKNMDYRGSSLFYQDEGSGSTVMLLHGFGESGSIWIEQAAYLKKDFRVITPDLPGSGSSPLTEMGDGFLTMEDYADAMLGILQKEQIDTITLIGHSMGGYIAMAFAEKYPAKLNAIGLFHSTAFADSEEKKKVREKGIQFILSNGPSAFLGEVIPNLYGDVYKTSHPQELAKHVEESKAFSKESLVSYYRAMMQRPDRKAVLQNFPKPVLFIMGEEDKIVNLQEGLSQCHLPAENHVHIWKQVAHMGMKESPEKTNSTLLEFLLHVNENKRE